MTLKELNNTARELGLSEDIELKIDGNKNESVINAYTDPNGTFLSICSKSDMSLYELILNLRDYYMKQQLDELDFFRELLSMDITIDDIKETFKDDEIESGFYEYAKKFMEEHGLI